MSQSTVPRNNKHHPRPSIRQPSTSLLFANNNHINIKSPSSRNHQLWKLELKQKCVERARQKRKDAIHQHRMGNNSNPFERHNHNQNSNNHNHNQNSNDIFQLVAQELKDAGVGVVSSPPTTKTFVGTTPPRHNHSMDHPPSMKAEETTNVPYSSPFQTNSNTAFVSQLPNQPLTPPVHSHPYPSNGSSNDISSYTPITTPNRTLLSELGNNCNINPAGSHPFSSNPATAHHKYEEEPFQISENELYELMQEIEEELQQEEAYLMEEVEQVRKQEAFIEQQIASYYDDQGDSHHPPTINRFPFNSRDNATDMDML